LEVAVGEKLKNLANLAAGRGSNYLKKDFHPEELSEKTAEFGVYLLCKSRQLEGKSGDFLAREIIELQRYVDHFRKMLFSIKMNKDSSTG
jgi:hypothetical protein